MSDCFQLTKMAKVERMPTVLFPFLVSVSFNHARWDPESLWKMFGAAPFNTLTIFHPVFDPIFEQTIFHARPVWDNAMKGLSDYTGSMTLIIMATSLASIEIWMHNLSYHANTWCMMSESECVFARPFIKEIKKWVPAAEPSEIVLTRVEPLERILERIPVYSINPNDWACQEGVAQW